MKLKNIMCLVALCAQGFAMEDEDSLGTNEEINAILKEQIINTSRSEALFGSPMNSPINSPIETPRNSPRNLQIEPPMNSPINSPIETPRNSPINSPIKTLTERSKKMEAKRNTLVKKKKKKPKIKLAVKVTRKKAPEKKPKIKLAVKVPRKEAPEEALKIESPMVARIIKAPKMTSPIEIKKVQPIFSKPMSEIAVKNYKELVQLALEFSAKENSRSRIDWNKIQNGGTTVINVDKKLAFITIPQTITNCFFKQNEFDPLYINQHKLDNGLIDFANNTNEPWGPEFWNVAILRNYVYIGLNGKLKECKLGEVNPTLKEIGEKFKKLYRTPYHNLIDDAVKTINECDTLLQLGFFMSRIERSIDESEPYLSVKNLPYITEIKDQRTNVSASGDIFVEHAYFIIDRNAVYKMGDGYKISPKFYMVLANNRLLNPRRFYNEITDENQIQNLEIMTAILNEYLELVNISKWRYPKQEGQQISKGTETYELTPELYRYNPLVYGSWEYFESAETYLLMDLPLYKPLIDLLIDGGYLSSIPYNKLILLLPSKYNNHKINIWKNLTKEITAKNINHRGFEIKLYQEGNDRGIQVIIPDAKPASDKAPMQMDA